MSLNALTVGILAHAADAADADRRRRLTVEVVPHVRVTEAMTAGEPSPVTVDVAKPEPGKGYGPGRVR